MLLELARLLGGLLLAAFHRPVSDFILAQDRGFAALARRGGIPLPAPLTIESSRTLFFAMGILVALLQMGRIYFTYIHH